MQDRWKLFFEICGFVYSGIEVNLNELMFIKFDLLINY